MTDTQDIAASWLHGLAARGVRVTIRNGRVWLHPAAAYKNLTDEELLTLRHHRAEIKAHVAAGVPLEDRAAQPGAAQERTGPAEGLDTAAPEIVQPTPSSQENLVFTRRDTHIVSGEPPAVATGAHVNAQTHGASGAAAGSADDRDARLKARDFETWCLVHPDHPEAIAYADRRWLRGE